MEQNTPPTQKHKAGFVAVAGRPNVGKSTLINSILGQKIAAVTARPQTTRKQQFGILTLKHAQIIFMDTPGIHHAHHKLGEWMNEEAASAFEDGDLLLVVVDGSQTPHADDRLLASVIAETAPSLRMIIAVNKLDLVAPADLPARTAIYQDLFPRAHLIAISAARGDNLQTLLDAIVERLRENPPFFPEDQITDAYEREIAADLIRAAALVHLRDEVPHSIAVRIDEYTERGDTGAFIAGTLFVERESQKGIVIGKGGKMLKRIGAAARQEIEEMSGRKVFLQLRVKLRKNWRNKENILQLFGFSKRK